MLLPALPSTLRLPFPSWRTFQPEAVEDVLLDLQSVRVKGLSSPVGSGKTAIALALARIYHDAGHRVCIVTATKGLQEQYLSVAPDLADVRGAGNYPCRGLEERIFTPSTLKRFWRTQKSPKCDDAPCHEGIECRYKESGCAYWSKVWTAKRKDRIPVTNYDYFILGQLGTFDLAILDEGHEIEKVLDRIALVDTHDMPPHDSLPELAAWAREELQHLKGDSTVEQAFERRIRRVAAIKDYDNYVQTEEGWRPVLLTTEAQALSSKADRMLIMSGTLTKGLVERFARISGGLTWSFKAFPSTFPVDTRRVHVWPVQRMGRSTITDMRWVQAVDRIIEYENAEDGIKGIIHTVSYDRAKLLVERSKYKHLMMLHSARTTISTVKRFKGASRGILVSPSVGTGYDFPYDACRWQVIVKVPYPNPTDPLTKARMAIDKTYASACAIAEIAQYVGRGTRAADDFCRTWVIDSMFPGLIWAKEHDDLVPKWLKEAYTKTDLGDL